jgi:glycine hydroxymethyltransferase
MHVIAAKAVAFGEALTDGFVAYQQQVVKNARALAAHLMEQGIELVSGGTDNHMMLADLRNISVTGKAAETALERAGLTLNKNAVPFDTENPTVTSGVRIGTPVMTTRGMKEPEMAVVAGLIVDVLKSISSDTVMQATRKRVMELCEAFPIYRDNDNG